MAPTRLSDAFIPEVYGSYSAVNNPETTQFFDAGVVVQTETMNEIARAGGRTATMPFWNDLDPNDEPNYSNDDPSDLATADAVTSGTQIARKAWLNKGYADMDIVQELAGSSPMEHIRNRFGVYWQRQFQRRLVASCIGLLNANVAPGGTQGGDMTVDISGESGLAAVFNLDAYIDAAYTMGQNVTNLAAVYVHTHIMARMRKDDQIVFVPDSEGRLTIPTYQGARVIYEDNPMLKNGDDYTSILFGTGAIGFGGVEGSAFAAGEGVPRVPFEVWRDPHQGNGGGVEEIWERRTWVLHPAGYQWFEEPSGPGAITEFSPTLVDLRAAAHWVRVVDRRLVPMAFLISRANPVSS